MTENEKKMISLFEWSLAEYLKLDPNNDCQRKVFAYLDMQADKLKSNPKYSRDLNLSQIEFNKNVDFCVKFVKADYNLNNGGMFSVY
jgi:hypothetical protein